MDVHCAILFANFFIYSEGLMLVRFHTVNQIKEKLNTADCWSVVEYLNISTVLNMTSVTQDLIFKSFFALFKCKP